MQDLHGSDTTKFITLSKVRENYPLDEKNSACYARISISKNRLGMRRDVLFVYERSIHTFIPVDLKISLTEGGVR